MEVLTTVLIVADDADRRPALSISLQSEGLSLIEAAPSAGWFGLAGVFSVVSKLEGIERLLAVVRHAERAGPGPYAPRGVFHA